MKTSSPRTFSSIFTNVSPSGNADTVHLPSSRLIDWQIASESGRLAMPLKIFTTRNKPTPSGNKKPPDRGWSLAKMQPNCIDRPRWRKRNLGKPPPALKSLRGIAPEPAHRLGEDRAALLAVVPLG